MTYNFTANANQLIASLDTEEGKYDNSTYTYLQPTFEVSSTKLYVKDFGVIQNDYTFPNIGTIGGDTPSDLQDAKDLLIALVANFNSGGGSPQDIQQVTTVGDTITGVNGTTVIDKSGGWVYVAKDDKTSQLVPEGIYLQDGVIQVLFLLGTGGLGIYNTDTGQATILDPVNGNYLATNTGSSVGMTVKTDNISTLNRTAQYQDKDYVGIADITDITAKRIVVRDNLAEVFEDLAGALTWLSSYYTGVVYFPYFLDGTFSFSVPANSDFSNSGDFLNDTSVDFDDSFGLVTTFGYNAFKNYTGNFKLGVVSFGNFGLSGCISNNNNYIKQVVSCGTSLGLDYTGQIKIDKLGTTVSDDLPSDIFTSANIFWIQVPFGEQYVNGGSEDGDIADIKLNILANNILSAILFK